MHKLQMDAAMKHEAMFANLLEVIMDGVAERLLAHMGTAMTSKVVYTTSKRGPHCPGKSRTWMMRHIKTMPGARHVGRDWVIDAADYDRWAQARDAATHRKAPPTLHDDEQLADAYLRNAGFRLTRKSPQ